MRIVRNERTFDLALSPDSRWLAASGFTDVTIYDTQTGGVVAILDGHTERVVSVDFSSDGRMLVTGSWDGVVRLWGTDALERAPQQMLDEIEAAWQMSLSEALSY